jgi:hypothetical protein
MAHRSRMGKVMRNLTTIDEKLITRGASFSDDKLHRLRLWRTWAPELPRVLFVGLNPSKADAMVDDMTVRKGIGFACRWGFGVTLHGNAHSLITTDPGRLYGASDAICPGNDEALIQMARIASLVVVCWGYFPDFDERFEELTAILRPWNPRCLGRTREGYPRHISRLAYATRLEAWRQC